MRLFAGPSTLVLPDNRIAFVDRDMRVSIVSLTGEQTIVLDRQHRGLPSSIAAGDGFIASAGGGEVVVTFEKDRTSLSRGSAPGSGGVDSVTLRGHVGAINALVVAPDGRTLVTGGGDGTARVWRLGETTEMTWAKD